jgi:phenylacetic acid degradation operon negative regulatory protein
MTYVVSIGAITCRLLVPADIVCAMAVTQVTDGVNLPRVQVGGNPQHLIVTLLGDYWFGRKEHLPSAGLVALANEFDITSTSARAALSRLARRGLLDSTKDGRRTFYGLTPRAERVLNEGLDRIMGFGVNDRPWDGSWSVVIFSVPEDQREVRHVLRTRLRWLGFAPLYDGAWVSPRAGSEETAALLDELDIASATLLTSRVLHASLRGDPLSAWDLDELRLAYEEFVAEFGALLDRVDAGDVGAAEALVARTRVMDVWRQFPSLDPELPEDILPSGWPRREAQTIFAKVYDALGPLAEMRVQQILAEYEPALAKRARHHTTS